MRLTLKLTFVIAIGVGVQMLINRHADDMDEAAFTFRVFVIHLCGGTIVDPGVLDLADDLLDRKLVRAGYVTQHLTSPRDDDALDPPVRVNASVAGKLNLSHRVGSQNSYAL